jgi:hypothetical protein
MGLMDTYLYAKVTSVDVITQEEIASVGGTATDFEKFHEVILEEKIQMFHVSRGE